MHPAVLSSLLPLLPATGAATFAVALALSFARIANALAWNADLVSPMVIADTVAAADGPHRVVFGTYAPYTSLWFNMATRDLPFHREVWETAPLVLSLLALGILVCVSLRLAGRWAALTTLAIGMAWSSPVLTTLVAQANHGATYFVVCLLAGFLWLVAAKPMAATTSAALAGAVGVVAGVSLASDPLLLLVGLAPVVGAPLLVAVRRWSPGSRRVLVLAGGASAVSLLVALATTAAMHSAGYDELGVGAGGSALGLASPSDAVQNARRLGENLLRIWGADALGRDLTPLTMARAALAGPVLAAVALPLVLLVGALRRPRDPVADARVPDLYLIFWGLVVALVAAGSVFSQLAVVNADRAVSYLTPVVLAVAATLPVMVAGARVAMVATGVGVALLCAISTVDVLSPVELAPYATDGASVIAAVERRGLRRGYAAYASASPLTYKSEGRLTVRPVLPCLAGPERPTLCGFFANRVEGWYVPVPGIETFLLADPTLPAAVPVPPPAELGQPSEVFTVGSQTVFVYPYDVATRFGPTF